MPSPNDQNPSAAQHILVKGPDDMKDEHLKRDSPFYTLVRDNPDLPRTSPKPRYTQCYFDPYGDSIERIHMVNTAEHIRGVLSKYEPCMGVLWIEEIDEAMVMALCDIYPTSNLLEFLHQHATRWEGGGVDVAGLKNNPAADPGPAKSVMKVLSQRIHGSPATSGVHFDGFCVGIPVLKDSRHNKVDPHTKLEEAAVSFYNREFSRLSTKAPYRTELLKNNGRVTERLSTRISCCTLGPKMYLVLVDAPLKIISPPRAKDFSCLFQGSHGTVLDGDPDSTNGRTFNPINALTNAIEQFPPNQVLDLMSTQPPIVTQADVVVHWLLVVSELQLAVDQAEREMRLQRHWSDASSNSDYTSGLADPRKRIVNAEMRILCVANLRERVVNAEMQILRDARALRNFPKASEMNHKGDKNDNAPAKLSTPRLGIATLTEKLANLQLKLDAVSKGMNDDMQLMIFREYRKRTAEKYEREMDDKRFLNNQAARANLLTLLAVIYLPLQLITGIFGMNIKEITEDGKLRWWACLVVFAVVIFLTFGILWCLYWQHMWKVRRRRSQLEA